MDTSWDAPSGEPSWMPFTEGSPLNFDQPITDGYLERWSHEAWGRGEVAPELPGATGALPCATSLEIGPPQQRISEVDDFAAIPPLPALYFGLERNSTMPLSLAPDRHFASHSVASPHLSLSHLNETTAAPFESDFNRTSSQPSFPDIHQLSELSEVQLENIAKDVSQALTLARQKRVSDSNNLPNFTSHQKKIRKVETETKDAQHKPSLFKCGYQDCIKTFRHKRDIPRHVRTIHSEGPGLTCPIVDCLMGTGHTMKRPDKMRDHLRVKSVFSRSWRCVIPNCSEVGEGKNWWYAHVAKHNQVEREKSKSLLRDYGFNEFYNGYFDCKHFCTRRGCPFGTNELGVLEKHHLIPHDGPHCLCPISECTSVWKDWVELEHHLITNHTRTARDGVSSEWQYCGIYSAFTCPVKVCYEVIKPEWFEDYKVREHCKKHGFETLLSAARPLVDAWRFYSDGQSVSTLPLKFDLNFGKCTSNQIFAYLAFSDEDLMRAGTNEGLERLCLEKGINLL